MKSSSNALVLIVAILAFLPVFAVDMLVDSYVKRESATQVQRAVNEISRQSESAIYDGLDAIGFVQSAAPSLCTPTFISGLHRYLLNSPFVRQITVEGVNGTQYCNAYDEKFEYFARSQVLSMPGRSETLRAVETHSEFAAPGSVGSVFYMVSQPVGSGKSIAAFVQFPQSLMRENFPQVLQGADYLSVTLSDGTELLSLGDSSSIVGPNISSTHLVVDAFAGDLPISVEAAVPFGVLQARYLDIYFFATLGACFISAALLLVVLQTIRRGNVPDFDLERAILRGDIKPYYQPVIDISSGRVVGCEVLARWIKSNGDVISPAAFIEYAEVTGLAVPMTLKIMEQVRDELGELCETQSNLKISINLFEHHFRDGDIIEDVQDIFAGSKVSMRQLVFEITERHPLQDEDKAHSVISGLRALGCRFAIDDLGTGHSNLAYLQKLGMDIVKIDRIFVEAVKDAQDSAPVLEGLINMGRELGADIVAEGVETEEQAKFLRNHGVTQVQGFMFSAAIPFAKFENLVRSINGQHDREAIEDDDAQSNLSLAS